MFTLETTQIYGRVSRNDSCASRLNHNCSLKLCHKLSWLFGKNREGNQHIMVKAFTHTNFCSSLVCHCTNGEGKCREAFVNLDKESTSALHFQVVNLLKLALKYRAPGFMLAWFAFSRRYVDIKADHITWGELPLLDLLSACCSVDDNIVAIDDVTLDFMGKYALNSIAFELFSDLLNHLGDTSVGKGFSNFSLRGLESVPGCEDHVSFASGYWPITNNNSCGCIR